MNIARAELGAFGSFQPSEMNTLLPHVIRSEGRILSGRKFGVAVEGTVNGGGTTRRKLLTIESQPRRTSLNAFVEREHEQPGVTETRLAQRAFVGREREMVELRAGFHRLRARGARAVRMARPENPGARLDGVISRNSYPVRNCSTRARHFFSLSLI